MKEKILAALKLKYKNLGLSEKTLEGIADMLVVTTTEEENIGTAVDGVETLLKGLQSDADKRVTDAVAKSKKEPAKQEKKEGGDPDPKNEPENKDDDEPAWAKKLAERLDRIEQGKTIDTRKQTLEAKLKDVNPAIKAKILKDFSRMKFETDEDFNTYVAETETDLGELSKAETESSLGALGKPFVAGGSTKTEATKEEVAGIINEIM